MMVMPAAGPSDGSSLGSPWSGASGRARPADSPVGGRDASSGTISGAPVGPAGAPPATGRDDDSGLGDPRHQDPSPGGPGGRPLSRAELEKRDRIEREREAAEALRALESADAGVLRLPTAVVTTLAWALMAVASVFGLVLVAQGAAAVGAIQALPTPFSWIAGGVAVASAGVLAYLIVRLGLLVARVRRTPSLDLKLLGALDQRRRWQYLAVQRADDARCALRSHLKDYDVRFVRRYLGDADGARIEDVRRKLVDDSDDRSSVEWLEAFGRFQAVLDGVAARRVRSYAIRVGLGTAASRFAVLDQVIVLSACLALLKELLSLYGLRPSALQTGVLLARAVVTTYLSGVVHDVSEDVAHATADGAGTADGLADDGVFKDLVGKLGAGEAVGAAGVLAPLAGRAAEAAVNGLLVARLGTSAVRLVQPIRRS